MRVYELAADLRNMNPKKIVKQATKSASDGAMKLLISKEHMFRAIRKIRREKGFDIEDPKSIADINIAKLQQVETIHVQKLFFGDTGLVDGLHRSLIFTTTFLLQILTRAKGIIVDATFDVSFLYVYL